MNDKNQNPENDDLEKKNIEELVEFAEMIRKEMERRLKKPLSSMTRIKLLKDLSKADRIVTEMKEIANDAR